MSRVGGMVTPLIANLADPNVKNGLLVPCLVYAATAFIGMPYLHLGRFLLKEYLEIKIECWVAIPFSGKFLQFDFELQRRIPRFPTKM
jgi:hypothetical protein